MRRAGLSRSQSLLGSVSDSLGSRSRVVLISVPRMDRPRGRARGPRPTFFCRPDSTRRGREASSDAQRSTPDLTACVGASLRRSPASASSSTTSSSTASRGTPNLRVTVDRAGGVDLDAITGVTRAHLAVLDDDSTLAGSFLLEVSSPGVERTLRTPAHSPRALGSTVSIKVPHRQRAPSASHGVLVDCRRRAAASLEGDDGAHDSLRRHHPGAPSSSGARSRARQQTAGKAATASKRPRASRGASA